MRVSWFSASTSVVVMISPCVCLRTPTRRYGFITNTLVKIIVVLRDIVVREERVKEVRFRAGALIPPAFAALPACSP